MLLPSSATAVSSTRPLAVCFSPRARSARSVRSWRSRFSSRSDTARGRKWAPDLVLGIVVVAAAVGMGMRPPRLLAMLNRTMHASAQLPVRISVPAFCIATLPAAPRVSDLEIVFRRFAAGIVIRLATHSEGGRPLRAKIERVCFGWFFPFFFVEYGHQVRLARLDAPT